MLPSSQKASPGAEKLIDFTDVSISHSVTYSPNLELLGGGEERKVAHWIIMVCKDQSSSPLSLD